MRFMPSDRTRQALLDILENATLARSFVGDMDQSDFAADRRTFYAAVRCLEIISEASRRLDEELLARHPELPWRAIMGSGNVYRHNYDNVAEAFVWRTVHDSLPPLLAVVRQELDGA
jgi:uncharacterized protein with HEPN domain